MKKIMLFILVGLCLVSLGTTAYYIYTNYHKTPESALAELRQETNAQILNLPKNNLVLLIDEKGDVSIAFMKVERLFNLYKDFKVFPTPLNIYSSDLNNEIPYATGPWYLEFTFGLVKNHKVGYTALGSTVRKDNVSNVFSVEDVINDADQTGVKVWYISSGSSSSADLKSKILFLDEDKETLEIGKKDFFEKKVTPSN
ncbi:hypothetical protein ACTL32_08670 [Planococcus sp. FY231025]|uniref:hypothetical protein n=1 Tax=Planococcus sp. FY231025 TaxID=3455699 RepID=UPI003F936288